MYGLPGAAQAATYLYGSPGDEQEQLQAWIDTAHVPTPNVRVRLYEGNCEEGRPGSQFPPERNDTAPEQEGQEASTIQTCMAFVPGEPDAYAIFIPHMAWHPQYPAWWWHLNLLNELGHVYDYVVGDRDHHREKFAGIFGFRAREWFPLTAWGALNMAWEKWSMAYAFCASGTPFTTAHQRVVTEEYAGFGYDPGEKEYSRVCELMARM